MLIPNSLVRTEELPCPHKDSDWREPRAIEMKKRALSRCLPRVELLSAHHPFAHKFMRASALSKFQIYEPS